MIGALRVYLGYKFLSYTGVLTQTDDGSDVFVKVMLCCISMYSEFLGAFFNLKKNAEFNGEQENESIIRRGWDRKICLSEPPFVKR